MMHTAMIELYTLTLMNMEDVYVMRNIMILLKVILIVKLILGLELCHYDRSVPVQVLENVSSVLLEQIL